MLKSMKEIIVDPTLFVRYANDCQGISVQIPPHRAAGVTIEEGSFFTMTSSQCLYSYYTGYTGVKHLDPGAIPNKSMKFILKVYKILELKGCPNLKIFLEKSLGNAKYILNTPAQIGEREFIGYRGYNYKKTLKEMYPKENFSWSYWNFNRSLIDSEFPFWNERVKRELENIIRVESITLRKYFYIISKPKYKNWNIFKILKLRLFKENKLIRFNARLKYFLEFMKEVSDLNIYIKDGNELKNIYINNKGYNMALINLFLEREINSFSNEISILDLCTNLGFIIPHYCYHYNLSIAGNCRMCLVELNANKKPIASCAIDSTVGMNIQTRSKLVERAREGIFEFLLVNHPLDCPVCDQGGECDLQDESLTYGNDRGRFYNIRDLKRSLTDFFLSPVIKVILTRCIFCTRCIRFLDEMEGNRELGLLGRGNRSEIGLYTERNIITELGSTITDFCPVGALTIKTYAYQYRAWEELYIESIDLNDSLCSSIRIYSDYKTITRVLPQYDVELGVNWINDKTRHIIDNLRYKQLGYPLFRDSKLLIKHMKICNSTYFRKNKYRKTSWKNLSILLNITLKNIDTEKVYGIYKMKTFLGDDLDLLTLLQLKELSLIAGSNYISNFTENILFTRSELINEDFDSNYLFRVNNLHEFKNIFLINLNLRRENPILNAKIRQKILWQRDIRLFFLGSKVNLTYKYKHIGNSIKAFLRMVEGRHHYFNFLVKDIKNNKVNPNLLIYSSELKKHYKNAAYRLFFNYLKGINFFFEVMYLSKGASSVGAMDLSIDRSITGGFSNYSVDNVAFGDEFEGNLISNSINYYVGCTGNNYLLNAQNFLNMYDTKVSIHQSHTKDDFFNFVDFFLPSYSHYESEKLFYINCFGILKITKKNFFGLTESVRDHKDLSLFIYTRLTYHNFGLSLLARVKDFAYYYNVFVNDYKVLENFFTSQKLKYGIFSLSHKKKKPRITLLCFYYIEYTKAIFRHNKKDYLKELFKYSYSTKKLFCSFFYHGKKLKKKKKINIDYLKNIFFYVFKYIYENLIYRYINKEKINKKKFKIFASKFISKIIFIVFSEHIDWHVRHVRNQLNRVFYRDYRRNFRFMLDYLYYKLLDFKLKPNNGKVLIEYIKDFFKKKLKNFQIEGLSSKVPVRQISKIFFGSRSNYYGMADNSSALYNLLRKKRGFNYKHQNFNFDFDFDNSLDFMLILTEISKNPKYHRIYYKFLLESHSVFFNSYFFKSLDNFFNKTFWDLVNINKNELDIIIRKKRIFANRLLIKILSKVKVRLKKNQLPPYSYFFFLLKKYSYEYELNFSTKFIPREDFFNENPQSYLYDYCMLLYPYINVSFFNPSTNLLSDLNFTNFFLLCMIHKDMFRFNLRFRGNKLNPDKDKEYYFDEYESYYYRNNIFENDENYSSVHANRLFREIYYNLYVGEFKLNVNSIEKNISYRNYFSVNFPVKGSFLERKFFSIYEKKKTSLVRINSIRTYLPINLYNVKRNEFYIIIEDANNYTFVYYYLLSEKERNFFRTNIFSYYSKNMGIMSTLNFKNKANFNL